MALCRQEEGDGDEDELGDTSADLALLERVRLARKITEERIERERAQAAQARALAKSTMDHALGRPPPEPEPPPPAAHRRRQPQRAGGVGAVIRSARAEVKGKTPASAPFRRVRLPQPGGPGSRAASAGSRPIAPQVRHDNRCALCLSLPSCESAQAQNMCADCRWMDSQRVCWAWQDGARVGVPSISTLMDQRKIVAARKAAEKRRVAPRSVSQTALSV